QGAGVRIAPLSVFQQPSPLLPGPRTWPNSGVTMITSFGGSVIGSVVLLGGLGQADVQKEKGSANKFNGIYFLYPKDTSNEEPIAKMAITGRGDEGFSVRGLGQAWSGEGRIDDGKGFYNWIFENGDSGKTTLTINTDGTLHGHVVGSSLN